MNPFNIVNNATIFVVQAVSTHFLLVSRPNCVNQEWYKSRVFLSDDHIPDFYFEGKTWNP